MEKGGRRGGGEVRREGGREEEREGGRKGGRETNGVLKEGHLVLQFINMSTHITSSCTVCSSVVID